MLKTVLSFIFVAMVITFSFNSYGKTSFMPENDLWKEDCLSCKTNYGLDQKTFEKIIDVAYVIYKPLADTNNELLRINKNWTDATVNANCMRSGGLVTVNMYGGLARRVEVTAEGFALVLCHELSHAYGGAPYIRPTTRMSAEGQSDYMATLECGKKVFKELNLDASTMEPTEFMVNTCNGDQICLSSLIGGQSLGNLLSVLSKHPTPNYETPDPTIVPKTLTSYPATTQCRLDSYFAGTMNLVRPACWFKN